LADANTELGRYDAGRAAARRMDDLQPSLSSAARLAYHAELRGDVAGAARLLAAALAHAGTPGEVAFAREQLGNLAWTVGHLREAEDHYRAALAADPQHVPAMFGLARVYFAGGHIDEALRIAGDVAARRPMLEYVVWYGELLDRSGRTAAARTQYSLARATIDLQRAQGVDIDLEAALFEADHGDATVAVRLGRAAYERRPSIYAADAYAWALHAAGRDREAARYAARAARMHTANALFAYHRGIIELAAGNRAAARIDLARALHLNPRFSPFHEARARGRLDSLGGQP
jgi:tetratricopeptide (TPR) repeat protein